MRSGGGVLRMKHLIWPFSPWGAWCVWVLEIVGGPAVTNSKHVNIYSRAPGINQSTQTTTKPWLFQTFWSLECHNLHVLWPGTHKKYTVLSLNHEELRKQKCLVQGCTSHLGNRPHNIRLAGQKKTKKKHSSKMSLLPLKYVHLSHNQLWNSFCYFFKWKKLNWNYTSWIYTK